MRKHMWIVATGGVLCLLSMYITGAEATPASGFSGTTVALGRFHDINVSNMQMPSIGVTPRTPWMSFQKSMGMSDAYIQNNTWLVGGTSGWHTHPGHSLIIVTAGEITAYDSSCTGTVYTTGMGFVDEGGDHAHVLRNETLVEARTMAFQLLPAGAVRRIDVPQPPNCPVF